MTKKRAMTETAKQEKAQAILRCAAELFLASDYESVPMSAIAKAMHISNGLLFVYFPTKQTLFFALLLREYHARIDALEQLVQAEPVTSYSALCSLIQKDLETQLNNTLYVRLESIRSAILEKNIPLSYILPLKQALYIRMAALAKQLAMPGLLTEQELMQLFHVQTALIAGFQQSSELPADLRSAYLQNGLDVFVHDARQDTLHTMAQYLQTLRPATDI